MSDNIIPICDDPLAINNGEPLPCEYAGTDPEAPTESGGCGCNGGGNKKTLGVMGNKNTWIWILIGAIFVYYIIRKFNKGGTAVK